MEPDVYNAMMRTWQRKKACLDTVLAIIHLGSGSTQWRLVYRSGGPYSNLQGVYLHALRQNLAEGNEAPLKLRRQICYSHLAIWRMKI